ncbi:hypothetical protein V8F20_002250 [Naviculisporaceae sp. PSN 640]
MKYYLILVAYTTTTKVCLRVACFWRSHNRRRLSFQRRILIITRPDSETQLLGAENKCISNSRQQRRLCDRADERHIKVPLTHAPTPDTVDWSFWTSSRPFPSGKCLQRPTITPVPPYIAYLAGCQHFAHPVSKHLRLSSLEASTLPSTSLHLGQFGAKLPTPTHSLPSAASMRSRLAPGDRTPHFAGYCVHQPYQLAFMHSLSPPFPSIFSITTR